MNFLFLGILLTNFWFPNSSLHKGESPPDIILPQNEADQILTEAVRFAISLADFEADFFYELQSPHRRGIRKKGTMLIKDQGGQYALQTEDQEVYVDGTTLWVYSVSYNEVYIAPYEGNAENVLESIFQLFRYKKDAIYLGTEVVSGNLCDKILVPFSDYPTSHYKEAYVWIGQTPRQRMIDKVTFLDGRQMATSYTFTEIRTNVGLEDDDFLFKSNNYPEIQIVDERQ